MNARSKGFLVLLAIILLAVPTIATLVSPTTKHKGALIYAEYWDFRGEVGARNGAMENVSIENATNVNSSNLNISSKFYVNTSGAIYQGTYNSTPIQRQYLDPTLVNSSNNSIIVAQKVDSCTGASDALGWNNTGFNCKTISSGSPINGTGINVTGSVVSQILSFWDYSTHFESMSVSNGWRIYDNFTETYAYSLGGGTDSKANVTDNHSIYLSSGLTESSAVFRTRDKVVIDSNPLIMNFFINYSNATLSGALVPLYMVGLNETFESRRSTQESGSNHVAFYHNKTGWYTVLADSNSARSDPIPAGRISNGTLLTIEVNASRVKYWINGTLFKQYDNVASDIPTIPLWIGTQSEVPQGTQTAPNQIWIDYMSIKKQMGY